MRTSGCPDIVARIAAVGTAPARFVGELLTFFAETDQDGQGFDFPPVHDPCAVKCGGHCHRISGHP